MDHVLDDIMQESQVVGVLVFDELALCIGYRGELRETDAACIAEILSRSGVQLNTTGEVPFGKPPRCLQFCYTASHTLAVLRSCSSGCGSGDEDLSSVASIKGPTA